RFEMRDVRGDGGMPDVRKRCDAGGKQRRTRNRAGSDGRDSCGWIGIRLREALPVASLAEARELYGAGRVLRPRTIAHQIEAAELETSEALERIAPPRAVIDLLAHRFAEFAIE